MTAAVPGVEITQSGGADRDGQAGHELRMLLFVIAACLGWQPAAREGEAGADSIEPWSMTTRGVSKSVYVVLSTSRRLPFRMSEAL